MHTWHSWGWLPGLGWHARRCELHHHDCHDRALQVGHRGRPLKVGLHLGHLRHILPRPEVKARLLQKRDGGWAAGEDSPHDPQQTLNPTLTLCSNKQEPGQALAFPSSPLQIMNITDSSLNNDAKFLGMCGVVKKESAQPSAAGQFHRAVWPYYVQSKHAAESPTKRCASVEECSRCCEAIVHIRHLQLLTNPCLQLSTHARHTTPAASGPAAF